jgi:hypothetical protein
MILPQSFTPLYQSLVCQCLLSHQSVNLKYYCWSFFLESCPLPLGNTWTNTWGSQLLLNVFLYCSQCIQSWSSQAALCVPSLVPPSKPLHGHSALGDFPPFWIFHSPIHPSALCTSHSSYNITGDKNHVHSWCHHACHEIRGQQTISKNTACSVRKMCCSAEWSGAMHFGPKVFRNIPIWLTGL